MSTQNEFYFSPEELARLQLGRCTRTTSFAAEWSFGIPAAAELKYLRVLRESIPRLLNESGR
jgi:hypothetical protein